MAEGIILEEDRIGSDELMKEVADRYLGELAKRCIVMVEEMSNPSHGRYYSCHDLMRDLCRAKAREEHSLQVLDYGYGIRELSNSVPNIPRVVISLSEDATKHVPVELEVRKSLRSLALIAAKSGDFIAELEQSQINRCKMLRSLIIEGVKTLGLENVKDGNQVPDGVFKLPIGKLIHLRYLRLTNSELVLSPSSITNMEHLELLDLRASKIIWKKNLPIKTRQLRHLHLPGESNFHMQIHVSNDLEVISGLANAFYEVKNLYELTNIRNLGGIQIHDEAKGVADIFKCLSNSHHLKQVIMFGPILFKRETDSEVLLGDLFGSNAQYIFIMGRIWCKLPDYESHFSRNLLLLHLDFSGIVDDPMKILENIPNLEKLEFRNHAFVGTEMVCHSMGLPRLRFLSLDHAPHSLETWIVVKVAMPNLVHLELIWCESLAMIPPELRFITSLKELVFGGMPEQFLKITIHNFSHVPSIVINGS